MIRVAEPRTKREYRVAWEYARDMVAVLREELAAKHCPTCQCVHEECGYVVNSTGCVGAHSDGDGYGPRPAEETRGNGDHSEDT